MKKIILFGLLLCSSLFADRYMMLFEYNFINGCAEDRSASKVNNCICMLSEIQKVVTEAEMLDYSIKAAAGQQTSDKVGAKIMDAAMKCTK